MRIWQPELEVLIRRGKEVEPRIVCQNSGLPLVFQNVGGLQLLLLGGRAQHVPQEDVLTSTTQDISTVRAEAALTAGVHSQRRPGCVVLDIAALARWSPAHTALGLAQEGLQLASESVEQVMALSIGAEEDVLAVVGELQLCPTLHHSVCVDMVALLDDVEDGEGLDEVAQVVQKNASTRRRCDCEDLPGGIVRGEVGGSEVELGGPELGVDVPKADSVVAAARDEVIGTGVHGKAGHGALVAFEVADEGVVMGRKVADGICAFGLISLVL